MLRNAVKTCLHWRYVVGSVMQNYLATFVWRHLEIRPTVLISHSVTSIYFQSSRGLGSTDAMLKSHKPSNTSSVIQDSHFCQVCFLKLIKRYDKYLNVRPLFIPSFKISSFIHIYPSTSTVARDPFF